MKTPSPNQVYRQLQDVISRMDTVEATLKEHGHKIEVLQRWHQDTDFAKKILKEYTDAHPEVSSNSINSRAWIAVLAALAAVTAVVLALSRVVK